MQAHHLRNLPHSPAPPPTASAAAAHKHQGGGGCCCGGRTCFFNAGKIHPITRATTLTPSSPAAAHCHNPWSSPLFPPIASAAAAHKHQGGGGGCCGGHTCLFNACKINSINYTRGHPVATTTYMPSERLLRPILMLVRRRPRGQQPDTHCGFILEIHNLVKIKLELPSRRLHL